MILKKVNSEINGQLIVKKDFAWGTYIQADGLTQSGGIVESIWKKTLKKLPAFAKASAGKQDSIFNKVLILGLGGGTIAKLARKNWPDANITGVDIDPIMVELGNRHLALGNSNVDINICDAYEFVRTSAYSLVPSAYDLIFVDLYQGDKFPKKFEEKKFLLYTRSLLSKDGVIIFNRLFGGNKRGDAMRFLQKLESTFSKVLAFYPEANVMFICR